MITFSLRETKSFEKVEKLFGNCPDEVMIDGVKWYACDDGYHLVVIQGY